MRDVALAHDTPGAVTCLDGRNAALAGATLKSLGYQTVTVLDGGMAAWLAPGCQWRRACPASCARRQTWSCLALTGRSPT
jgi:rhodanese-related sulfurtransferase